ncbi:MAG: alpha/beta fold hydrolase [Beijerinckiaceae bacterium]|nr:alpha/beta fold hydrolase [Beijerinckiaceae bacterium]
MSPQRLPVRMALLLVAAALIALSLWRLHAASEGVLATPVEIGGAPATVFRLADSRPAPVIVIAHGFAGSQQLMQSFAYAFARNGYVAVTFDFPGHGRNRAPMRGSITQESGATRNLVAATAQVADYARTLGDGRLAVLGHSMASDIVIRYAIEHPDVVATIAVSMFSPVVTAAAPRNLLVIVGEWEGMLTREALRVTGLASAPQQAQPGVTYGDFASGTARRAAISPHVEHASVLFSETSLREAIGWLDQSFGVQRAGAPAIPARGPWIMLLLAAVVLLARQLAPFLPRVCAPAAGASLPWRKLWIPLLAPMILTPLILRVVPTGFLPVLVAEYLAAHFFVYGLLTALFLGFALRGAAIPWLPQSARRFVIALVALVVFNYAALAWPIDVLLTSYAPGSERAILIVAMLAGALPFFLADEWMTRGPGAARMAYATSKLAFVASLAFAIALDFQRLFFLAIITPFILAYFVVYGLISRWTYQATGHPFVAGLANALAVAWAIAATFPLLSR